MLFDTSQLLTRLTDHAAVVVGAPLEQATIRSVQLVGLSSRVVLAVTVLSNGAVERQTIELGAELARRPDCCRVVPPRASDGRHDRERSCGDPAHR